MLTTTVQKRMDMLPNIARAGRPVNGLTRLMASPSLWLNAVERIRKNNGSLTPGVDGQTLDGLTAHFVRQRECCLLPATIWLALRVTGLPAFGGIDAEQTDARAVYLNCVAVDDRRLSRNCLCMDLISGDSHQSL